MQPDSRREEHPLHEQAILIWTIRFHLIFSAWNIISAFNVLLLTPMQDHQHSQRNHENGEDAADGEALASCSSKDLSQLISSWIGKQNYREYAHELQMCSGVDFQNRILNRRRPSTEREENDADSVGASAKEGRKGSSIDGKNSGEKRNLEECEGALTSQVPRLATS